MTSTRSEQTPIIATHALTKFYGRHRGIEKVDLLVESGEVFGFVGPNGAGKTTAIRLLLDLIRPTSGSVRLFGIDVSRASVDVRRRVGYQPSDLALYDRLVARDHLAWLHGLRGAPNIDRTAELAERLDLDLNRPIRDLSSGNRQKVGVIQAFAHDPELIILDEPTDGLDPLVRHELLSMIGEERDRGKTVFLSSHVLDEVEDICDRIGVVREGRLVATESMAAIRERSARHVDLRLVSGQDTTRFAKLDGVSEMEQDGDRLRFILAGSVDPLVKLAATVSVDDLSIRPVSLAESFLSYYSGTDGRPAVADSASADGDPNSDEEPEARWHESEDQSSRGWVHFSDSEASNAR